MPDIACIGRYWPGDSPIHRMDARAKLLLSLAVMAIAFVAQTFAALGVVALFTVALFALSGIPLKSALRSIVPLLFIVVITALLNVLFVHTGDVVFQWWVIEVTTGGIRMAAMDYPVGRYQSYSTRADGSFDPMFGTVFPFPAEQLTAMYGSLAHYRELVERSAEETIALGFLLREDKEAYVDATVAMAERRGLR